MDLNCVGPLTRGYFSVVNATALQALRVVESADVDLGCWGPTQSCIWIFDVLKVGGPHPRVVPGSVVISYKATCKINAHIQRLNYFSTFSLCCELFSGQILSCSPMSLFLHCFPGLRLSLPSTLVQCSVCVGDHTCCFLQGGLWLWVTGRTLFPPTGSFVCYSSNSRERQCSRLHSGI